MAADPTPARTREEASAMVVLLAHEFHDREHAAALAPFGGPYPPCDCALARAIQALNGLAEPEEAKSSSSIKLTKESLEDVRRAALRQAREALRAFRAYYVHDHRLGLDPSSNPEIRRADAVLAAIDAALEE